MLVGWLALACLSGLLLIWEDDYYGFRYPSLPDSSALIEPDARVIKRILASTREPIQLLGMPTRALPAYHAYYANGGEALLHPDTGELVASWTYLSALPAFLFELHANLLFGDTGHTVVGWLGVLVLVNVIAGFVLWIRKRQIFQLRFLIPRTTSRALLMRAHAAQGALLSVVFLVLTFSGVAIVFAGPVQAAFNAFLGSSGDFRPTVTTIESTVTDIDWASILDSSSNALPDAELRFVYLPAKSNDAVVLRLRNNGELHPNGRSYVTVAPYGGPALQTIDATKTGLGPAVFNALYPLHAGKTGWPGYRFGLTLVSLSLLFVVTAGGYLFLSRLRLKRR